MTGEPRATIPLALHPLADEQRRLPVARTARQSPARAHRDLGARLALWLADVAAEATAREPVVAAPDANPSHDWPEAG